MSMDRLVNTTNKVADGTVKTGACVYFGLALRSTTAAAATVLVYDGTDATGELIDEAQTEAGGGTVQGLLQAGHKRHCTAPSVMIAWADA